MQSNIAKKIFSITLSICLILQMGVGTVFADQNTPRYTSFEIPADKQNITVPVGTTETEVRAQLPMEFDATIEETATTTGSALNVEVNIDRWLCSGFSSETPGEEFAFKGVPVWPYDIAEGTELPVIKVKIAGELALPDGMTLEAGATYGGDISNRGLSLIGGIPDKKMQYKAGEGYVLFIPAAPGGNPTIEFNDATIEQDSPRPFELPQMDVNMVFKGSTTLYGDLPRNVNITLAPNAEFELKKTYAAGQPLMYIVANKMTIGENAKLIIDEEVGFVIRERAADNSSLIDSRGSIIVRGGINFEDPSYLVDIPTMNIKTEGDGKVVVNREVINPENGMKAFEETTDFQLTPNNNGEYNCGSGTIKWEPIVDGSGSLTGGVLTMNNATINMKEGCRTAIRVRGGEDVPITLNVIGNNTINNRYGDGISIDTLTLTGSGNLSIKTGDNGEQIAYENKFDIANFTGKLNAIAVKTEYSQSYGRLFYATVYGNAFYLGDEYYKEFTVNEGSKLTIEPGAVLKAEVFTSHGEIINNGTLHLKRDVNDAELNNWVYDSLNLKGNGIVIVSQIGGGSIEKVFTNEGKLIKEINDPLDFSTVTENKGELAKDGYHWDNASKTLTLENLKMKGYTENNNKDAITLPEGENVTLILKGYNNIEGFKSSIYQGRINYNPGPGEPLLETSGSLTIAGDGQLTSIPSTANSTTTKVLTTTGKLVMQSGSLIMKGEDKRGIDAAGVEIKGGTIGSSSINATINSYGDFLMSGGSVISGSGDGGSLIACGDVSITGGDLVTQDEHSGIVIRDGNFSMTGGKLTIHNSGNRESTGIVMSSMRREAKKFSITGGALDIKSGQVAISFMGFAGGNGEIFVFETTGMDITTAPKGGTLKYVTIPMPPIPSPGPMIPGEDSMPPMPIGEPKIYSFTADKELKIGMGMEGPIFKNACKEINIVKAAVKPTDPTNPNKPNKPSNPSDGASSGGGGGVVTPNTPATKTPDAPTKVATEVAATVTGKTANISVQKEQVSEAIKKAQEEAKKNANEKNGIVVELKADTKDAKVENISAKLPKDSVAELVKEGVKELSINTGAGKINLDLETLKTIQKQAGSDVAIEAKKVDTATLSAEVKAVIGNRPVYDFSITGENGQKVTEFGNGNISVSLPYTLSKNEKAEDLTVYYIDDKGNLKEMKNVVYDEKTKTISFTTNHFSKFAVGKKRITEEATASSKTVIDSSVFTDITNHWAKDDIAFVTQRGLFGGTAKDKFSPNMPMTRGMFVTVLGRLANADVSSSTDSKFTDVKAGAYYAPYVQWANKNNIITGTASDKFSPNTPITREQMAAIIANYSKFAGVNPPKLQSDEKGVATRAQVSAVLRRYIEFLESK